MKSRSILLLFFIVFSASTFAQKPFKSTLRSGDILFQDLDCGELCDAIEQVTESYGGRHFSHLGLVSVEGAFTFVIEAIGDKVQRTPINDFLDRNKNEILLGRVKNEFQNVAAKANDFAQHQIDVPYDDAFLVNNGKYYCSELLYDAFKFGNNGADFFELQPMTFMQPKKNNFFPAWEAYYQKLQMPIPEGAPGINPGGISMSPKLDVFLYRK